MKKILSFIILSLFVATVGLSFANTVEAKSYSYKSYKAPTYKSYKAPTYKNYKSGGTLKYQNGYYKPSSGKYINGHFKTGPDNYKWNNRKSLYGW
ncbi:MAG: hypothetical protein ABIA02_02330 [Candidatus Falkowbacteria bacterium]